MIHEVDYILFTKEHCLKCDILRLELIMLEIKFIEVLKSNNDVPFLYCVETGKIESYKEAMARIQLKTNKGVPKQYELGI